MVSYDNINECKIKKLKKYGYELVKTKTIHEKIRYVGKTTIVLYKTGKLLIQGSKKNVDETKKLVEYLDIVKLNKQIKGLAVGTDETLKGDTFGGIVVAGFKADDDIRKELNRLGVKDSKQMINPEIVKLAQTLIKKYPKNYCVESLTPKEYNKMNLRSNVTKILDKLHKKCYSKLSRTGLHIVDLYPGCSVGHVKEKKAESKYLEVAAASIIARYHGLKQIRELEHKAGFFIPLGSTDVESALLEIKKKSLNPKDYVKLKFRNVVKFFE